MPLQRTLPTASCTVQPDGYKQIGEIWNGLQAETGEPREVQDGPPEGGEVPDLTPPL